MIAPSDLCNTDQPAELERIGVGSYQANPTRFTTILVSTTRARIFPTIWTNAGTQFSQERHVAHPGSRLLRADVLKQSGS